MLTNPVVLSIIILLVLSLLRINVVISLVISALAAGLLGNLGLSKTNRPSRSCLCANLWFDGNLYAFTGGFRENLYRKYFGEKY